MCIRIGEGRERERERKTRAKRRMSVEPTIRKVNSNNSCRASHSIHFFFVVYQMSIGLTEQFAFGICLFALCVFGFLKNALAWKKPQTNDDIMNANDWVIAVKYWIRDLIINFAKCLGFVFAFHLFFFLAPNAQLTRQKWMHANDGENYQQMNRNWRRNINQQQTQPHHVCYCCHMTRSIGA